MATTRTLPLVLSAATAVVGLVLLYRFAHSRKSSEQEVAAIDESENNAADEHKPPVSEVDVAATSNGARRILTRNTITIVHGTITGTCSKLAKQLHDEVASGTDRPVQLLAIDDLDWWDELINDDDENNNNEDYRFLPAVLIIFLSTSTGSSWPVTAETLKTALEELGNDWRIASQPLNGKLQVAVFGTGSSEYGDGSMGKPAKECMRLFTKLGAKSRVRLGIGDDAIGTHTSDTFEQWKAGVLRLLQVKEKPSCDCGETNEDGCCQSEKPEKVPAEVDDGDSDVSDDEEPGEPEVMDLEDMGDSIMASKLVVESSELPEMVTPTQAAALKKEGYRLIGTHSAVKLCRWTKHQLRGRGGCYKHTFYGITSYQCMEATPSLACANKCVFCWRHHKNPVGKEWRWKIDDPYYIVDQAVQTHIMMIKEAKGIPGVRLDRWHEAHTVRHCALSLVGEPIMYPRIDELLGELHRRNISTYLVTNGQHPQAISSLRPITQLYVSVDAPTKESLIAIDRPLFNDAWERLKLSLSSLKDKGQRTVARLTVVKGWNSDEVGGYAQLIALGQVSLVEVKGVTFCGKSDASNLNMSNTPWHHEVVDLTRKLKGEIDKLRAMGGDCIPPEYDLACEHKHSCSVLLARVDQFAVVDPVTGLRRWRTWIDYDKFQELAARHGADPSFTFTVEDYTAETPPWALFGSDEEGFDPTDKRHRKKTKHPKYTLFDDRGVPTHDDNGQALEMAERQRLASLMEARMNELGSGSTVTELRGGAKEVTDASLMFRGMVVAK